MKVDGHCHCGSITYEADIDPATVFLCHCTDCQSLTGAPFRAIVRAPAHTFVLRGTPTLYVKTAESGNRRVHAFCPTCGSPVYATTLEEPRTAYSLRVGGLRQRAELPPQRQNWCRSALPWAMNVEELTRVDRQ
jgi:hypothetical protein